MTSDVRLTWGFITDVPDVLKRHGYRPTGNEHTGQAIGLIPDVARIYDGTLDVPRGGYVVVAILPAGRSPAARTTCPGRLSRPGQDPARGAGRRRRIQARPGRDLRRLRRPTLHHLANGACTAGAYDHLAEHMTQAAEAAGPRQTPPSPAAPGTGGPHPSAGREAGQ